jgi:anti-anti-sigma factor
VDVGVDDELASDVWSIEVSEADGRSRLTLRGELDALTAVDLHHRIAQVAEGDLELDLGGVTFIDSSGLAAIIEGHLRLGAQQRRLVIIERSPAVQRVFDLSGVGTRLDLGSSEPTG